MCSIGESEALSIPNNAPNTLEEEQYLLAWLERAAASAAIVEPISYEQALERTSCRHCHSSRGYQTCSLNGDSICVDCGALLDGGRVISCDDGRLRSKREREPDDNDIEVAERAANSSNDHARAKFQSYRRVYHFNERIAARQNSEPRIPYAALVLFARTTRHILGLSADASFASYKNELSEPLLKGVCRLYKPLGLEIHAERWIQIRYFFITGRRERSYSRGLEKEHSDWDIPWLKDNEIRPLQRLFSDLSTCFDRIFYRPSARFTLKDYFVVASLRDNARHNILQLDYMMQHIIFIVLGEKRFIELKTPFCFPTNMRLATKAALDEMMNEMIEYYNENRPIEKRIKFTPL